MVRGAPGTWPPRVVDTLAPPFVRAVDYLMRIPVMERAITRRWISEVPSKIV